MKAATSAAIAAMISTIGFAKAEENGRALMREDLMTFLDEQTAELTEYDEQLVRRLIENIIIRTDGTYKIEFKSGTTIEL